MQYTHLLRCALLCVAATTGSLLASSAEASRTVIIGRGDSLDSLARRYRVPVREIAKANGITPETILRDGRKVVIPDSPKTLVRPATMRRVGVVTGNRIAIRSGPDQDRNRLTLVDHGYELQVQRKSGDWYQVKTQIGRIGWIRSDFVQITGRASSRDLATRDDTPKRVSRSKRIVRSSSSDERRASARGRRSRVAREERSTRRTRSRRYASSHSSRSRRVAYSRRHRRPEADAPEAETDVVRMAYSYRGTPYRFGASGKRGFDCSGFTSYVYRKQGVSLPHNAAAQFGHGERVKSNKMQPGDLVFFHTTRRGISHVGIYAGKGKFVHASSGGGSVRVDSLNSGYYRSRLVGARRVK